MKLRNIFQTRPKISDLRLESYTTILKQLSTSTENGLRKKFFECDLFYMIGFFMILSCFFELLSKCSQSCCQNCTLGFQRIYLTSFFAELSAFSPVLNKNLSKFWPWSVTIVLKKAFNVFRGTIGENVFFKFL